MDLAKIIYKPHCGECGHLIDTEVTYQDVYTSPTEVMLSKRICSYIYPNKCAFCGVSFENIQIEPPKRLSNIYQDIYNDW